MRTRLDRRTFLRGASGGLTAAIALPPLQAMFDDDRAFAAGAGRPRVWFTYQPNGYAREVFYPKGTGRTLDFRGCSLEALAPLQEKITIFKHLENPGKNGQGSAHPVALASYLTGKGIANVAGANHVQSIDHFISAHYQATAPTPTRHLNLCGSAEVDPPTNPYNVRYQNSLAFDDQGRFVSNTNNLKAVFDTLFAGAASPAGDPMTAARALRSAQKKSVLDFALTDARTLNGALGAADRQVLDQYLTSLRELERSLAPATTGSAACAPGPNGFQVYPPGPKERVDRVGEHWKETARLLALAFQCEATRVATYLMGGEATDARYPEIGVNAGHHSLSHNASGDPRAKYVQIDRYHARVFAEVIELFARTPLGAETLLDQTVLVWGSGLGDGNPHEKTHLMAIWAGQVGGVRHGSLIDVANRRRVPVLLNTVLRSMGVPAPNGFGEAGAQDLFDLRA